jgi:hypothetical protein
LFTTAAGDAVLGLEILGDHAGQHIFKITRRKGDDEADRAVRVFCGNRASQAGSSHSQNGEFRVKH